MNNKYDFAGWVTKNDIRCSDGVTIKHNAFKGNDSGKVPLVWEHDHNDPSNVLGNVQLENRDGGVYGYGTFNETDSAKSARELIAHGDISSMSIAANHIKKNGNDVIHGRIYEVSLVLAGANPGAMIDTVVSHSDGEGDQAIIYTDNLIHSAQQAKDAKEEDKKMKKEDEQDSQAPQSDDKKSQESQVAHAAEPADGEQAATPADAEKGKTVGDIMDTLSDEQMEAVQVLIGSIIEGSEDTDPAEDKPVESQSAPAVEHSDINKGGKTMKKNVFDNKPEGEQAEGTLTHSELNELVQGAVKSNAPSLKAVLEQSVEGEEGELRHSITNIESLFPDFKNFNDTPQVLDDPNTNSQAILDATSKTPFSRIKNTYADLTVETARARGYIKGKEKLEQVYGVLNRTTTPQTVYAKQKLDRDDIIDITDFDVVSWAQANMKSKLTQELARAILVGDGREVTDSDKIQEEHIRPILSDDKLYTAQVTAATVDDVFKTMLRARIDYQGSGQPSLYLHPSLLAEMLLLKDTTGRFLFGDIPSVEAMAARLRVKAIVETTILPVDKALVVNLADYAVGSTKGGEVTTFDDFDIDFNQYKYLIETRLSGALKQPKSAIVITVSDQTPAASTPAGN